MLAALCRRTCVSTPGRVVRETSRCRWWSGCTDPATCTFSWSVSKSKPGRGQVSGRLFYYSRTIRTGQWACLTTESETLPISARLTPPNPLLPRMIKPAPISSLRYPHGLARDRGRRGGGDAHGLCSGQDPEVRGEEGDHGA